MATVMARWMAAAMTAIAAVAGVLVMELAPSTTTQAIAGGLIGAAIVSVAIALWPPRHQVAIADEDDDDVLPAPRFSMAASMFKVTIEGRVLVELSLEQLMLSAWYSYALGDGCAGWCNVFPGPGAGAVQVGPDRAHLVVWVKPVRAVPPPAV